MRIDLHCHTKKIKQGDAYTRQVTKDKFIEKVIEADVKLIAITNHNHFDIDQYYDFREGVKKYCDVWPGIELDVECKHNQEKKRGHLIVISNPRNVEDFSLCVQTIINNVSPDDFITNISSVFETFNKCDCLYIPHYHKEPGFSEKDINELAELLDDSSRLFRETSDYRSLGVYTNFDYSVIIGSDVQNWDEYEKSKFADIRLPIKTFHQFCLLAQKDKVIIDSLINKKNKRLFKVSPVENVFFNLSLYEDINVIFGQKGTGKSEILASLKRECNEKSLSYVDYIGSEKDKDFSEMLKTDRISISAECLGIDDYSNYFDELCAWKDVLPTPISQYVEWYETKDNNANKSKMKITEIGLAEVQPRNRKLENDSKRMEDFLASNFFKINFDEYLTNDEISNLYNLINLLCCSMNGKRKEKWIEDSSISLTNWSIDKIKSIADKCSNTISKPSKTGFFDFAINRFEVNAKAYDILQEFNRPEMIQQEQIGFLEEKGEISVKTVFRMLCKDSHKEEFSIGINSLKKCKQILYDIEKKALTEELITKISALQELCDGGIKKVSDFIGVRKEIALNNGEAYKPSNGERAILLMQKVLASESDVYILDEPELGMGNSYITSSIVPKLIDLARRRKTIVIATHNANLAVGSLPYVSVLRTHKNGEYKTYVGNPFSDDLVNIEDKKDIKNWTEESLHTLEGGKDAFYTRKDIYESGM